MIIDPDRHPALICHCHLKRCLVIWMEHSSKKEEQVCRYGFSTLEFPVLCNAAKSTRELSLKHCCTVTYVLLETETIAKQFFNFLMNWYNLFVDLDNPHIQCAKTWQKNGIY